jgi:FixJ family two-component response regulator
LGRERFVVYVVDPDQAIGEGLTVLLNTYGFQVQSYRDAESFLEARPHLCSSCCCLLVEANLPGLSGPALLQQLRDEGVDSPAILLLSTSYPDQIKQARRTGRISVMEKPLVNGMLIEELLKIQQAA